jgi:hypothetical protein
LIRFLLFRVGEAGFSETGQVWQGAVAIPQGLAAVEQESRIGRRSNVRHFRGWHPPLSRWLKGFSEAHALAIFATYKNAALAACFL